MEWGGIKFVDFPGFFELWGFEGYSKRNVVGSKTVQLQPVKAWEEVHYLLGVSKPKYLPTSSKYV